MKTNQSVLCTLTAGALLFAGSVFAQEAPVPPPPPPPPMPAAAMPPAPPAPPAAAAAAAATPGVPAPAAAPATPGVPAPAAAPMAAGSPVPMANGTTATFQTPQGELTVRSAPAPAPSIGPAPGFGQLAAGGKGITEAQAEAYPPLANDFINADQNRNGTVSAAEYAHWTKQL